MRKLIAFVLFLILVFSFVGLVLAEEENFVSNESEDLVLDSENNDSVAAISSVKRYDRNIYITNVTKNVDAATIYCEKKGYSATTRVDTTGKEYRVCVFPDGKECLSLEFLRGKCGAEYAKVDDVGPIGAIVVGLNQKLKEKNCDEGCQLRIGESKITIKDIDGMRRSVDSEGINANTELDLTVDEIEGKMVLRAYLSNGRWALVKYLPDRASEKASDVLGEKCAERNCTIELKEIKVSKKDRLAYEIKTHKEVKIARVMKRNMAITAQVDAESGQLIAVKKPWWAFLAN